jgi:Fe-S-cluster containining protein
VSEDRKLPAGNFVEWLEQMQGAIRAEHGSDVPCDGCTACCTSSQFVHIGPDETDTLAHIPAESLFPAPLRPRGHVVLGYDARGHCPMLVDNRCSIYEHRPVTCRTYDCRIFAAAGIEIDDADKALVNERVGRWRFALPGPDDERRLDAVRRAAAYFRAHPEALASEGIPDTATGVAVLAIERYDQFLRPDR